MPPQRKETKITLLVDGDGELKIVSFNDNKVSQKLLTKDNMLIHINNMNSTEEKDGLNLTLAQQYSDEDAARGLLESILWPDGAICPHCKNHKEKPIYKLQSKADSKSKVRKGVYKCGACRKQFTVTVGTIFEASHLPISKWLMAIFIICSSKKSIGALQLSPDAEHHLQGGLVHGASPSLRNEPRKCL